ncbi:MAG: DUF3822 family protein [Bacteroidia bacterium]
MSSYHNAVSDQLVVLLYQNECIYKVFGKDNNLKESYSTSIDGFPSELEGAIFSSTKKVSFGQNFTLVPAGETDVESYFNLNFKNEADLKSKVCGDFRIVYPAFSYESALNAKLVNSLSYSDIELVYSHLNIQPIEDGLFFYVINESITVLGWKNGVFHLANRYPATSDEELFYYVMLVKEQLDLNIDKLRFECIGSQNYIEGYNSLFKDYLPTIRTEISNQYGSLEQFLLSCVL